MATSETKQEVSSAALDIISEITNVSSSNENTFVEFRGSKFSQESSTLHQARMAGNWEHDPHNPRDWPLCKKWTTIMIVSLYTAIPIFAHAMISPGLPNLAERFGIHDSTILGMTLSISLIGDVAGVFFWAPISELYGRTWILHLGLLLSLSFSLGCGLAPNVQTLLVFRFLFGFSASTGSVIGAGSVSDLFSPQDRAIAMSVCQMGTVLASCIGSVGGGFICQMLGVRWVFFVLAIACGVLSIFGILILQETYAPVIRFRKCKPDRVNDTENCDSQPIVGHSNDSFFLLIRINLFRPYEILCKSIICFIFSLYLALIFGISYLISSTVSAFIHQTYGFQPGASGLAYFGTSVGNVVSVTCGARFASAVYNHLTNKNDGKGAPEMRMPHMVVGSIIVPAGLLWYGWSAQARLHWIMPIIGTAIFTLGLATIELALTLYVMDTFEYAASALAATSVFKHFVGFAFPLFGAQMFHKLGYGGANSLLAGVAIVLGIPFPILIYYKGESMRSKSTLTKYVTN